MNRHEYQADPLFVECGLPVSAEHAVDSSKLIIMFKLRM
jgi:succinyl-CoA synthetase beta subunit